MPDLRAAAAALYDGGWRSGDEEWLQEAYPDLTSREAKELCKLFEEFEEKENL